MIANTIMDEYNAFVGMTIAILSMIFGEHWWLFGAFLVFNILDWISGWMNGRSHKEESSKKGLEGVLKKIGYWILILLSFFMSMIFIEIGKIINVNLHITTLLGWFVLASLMVNEIRSIVENLVEMGIQVPIVLMKGLEIADKVIDEVSGDSVNVEENARDRPDTEE